MRLTITDSIKIDSIEVEPNQLVEDVKAVIEVQVQYSSCSLAFPLTGRFFTIRVRN